MTTDRKKLLRREIEADIDALGNTQGRPVSALLARLLTWLERKLQ